MKKTVTALAILLLPQAVIFGGRASQIASQEIQQSDVAHPYHAHPPSGQLVDTLDPKQFGDDPPTFVAYTLAGRIRKVLYQEPCFCPCHKEQHHQSLLDCFAGEHGISCYLCKQELVYCYDQARLGKNVREIRLGLLNQEWNKIDVKAYASKFLSEAH